MYKILFMPISSHSVSYGKCCTINNVVRHLSYNIYNIYCTTFIVPHISYSIYHTIHRSEARDYKTCHFRCVKVLFMPISSSNLSYDHLLYAIYHTTFCKPVCHPGSASLIFWDYFDLCNLHLAIKSELKPGVHLFWFSDCEILNIIQFNSAPHHFTRFTHSPHGMLSSPDETAILVYCKILNYEFFVVRLQGSSHVFDSRLEH